MFHLWRWCLIGTINSEINFGRNSLRNLNSGCVLNWKKQKIKMCDWSHNWNTNERIKRLIWFDERNCFCCWMKLQNSLNVCIVDKRQHDTLYDPFSQYDAISTQWLQKYDSHCHKRYINMHIKIRMGTIESKQTFKCCTIIRTLVQNDERKMKMAIGSYFSIRSLWWNT